MRSLTTLYAGMLALGVSATAVMADAMMTAVPDAPKFDAQGQVTFVGMPTDILSRFPHEFSGGQRQRLAIARAIAVESEFIMLDEPTSALDLSVQDQIIELLRKLQRERGLSYLFISHDLKVVRALCHRVIVMQHGKIVEQGPVADVLTHPQTDYTKRLVRAAFDIAA